MCARGNITPYSPMRTFRFTLRVSNSPATCASMCGILSLSLSLPLSFSLFIYIYCTHNNVCARVYYSVSPRHRVSPALSAAAAAAAATDVAHPHLHYIMMSKQRTRVCVYVCITNPEKTAPSSPAPPPPRSNFPPRPQDGWYIIYVVICASFVLIYSS